MVKNRKSDWTVCPDLSKNPGKQLTLIFAVQMAALMRFL
jgi:hypothetical protein